MANRKEYKTITKSTKQLLLEQESREVDYKIKPFAIDPEDFVAFSNTVGGTILVGVDEIEGTGGIQRGKIVGCKVDDQPRQAIIGKAISCRPSIDIHVQVENINNKPIIKIDIPEGKNKPYSTSSGTYKIRADGRNVAIDPPFMKALILQSESDEFIQRFRHAASELILKLQNAKSELSCEIKEVKESAELAKVSARQAKIAALKATDAAYQAVEAAEFAGAMAASH